MGSAAIVVVVVVLAAAGLFVVLNKQGSSTAIGPGSVTSEIATTEYSSTPTFTSTRTTTTSPTPTTPPTPTGPAALGDNPLYSNPNAGLAKQPCNPVGWPSDVQAAEAFFQSVMPCLEAAWKPLITQADLPFSQGAVLVPSGRTVSNPCGTLNMDVKNWAAFYCSANSTLYMPIQSIQVEDYGNQPLIYIAVLAHEFGHHVQNITGTSGEEWKQEKAAGEGSAAALELSRRAELQAQCFSGMFVSAIIDSGGPYTQADSEAVRGDQERGDHSGGPRDHGSDAHSSGWWNQGYEDNQIFQCNTWRAPSDAVS